MSAAGARGAALLALACVALGITGAARAQSLDACADAAERVLASEGRAVGRAFLAEHESAVFIETLPRDGCVAYLAIGGAQLRDIDLLTHTSTGVVLEEDVEPRAWGWVRACGAAGLEVAVIAHAFGGRGEARVIAFDGGPEVAPDLGREVGGCFARSSGERAAISDTGAVAPMRSLATALAASERDADAIGATPTERPIGGALEPGATDASRFALRAGRCYRVDALAGPDLRDFALVVLAPDGALVAQDLRRARDARVALCPSLDGGYVVQVRARSGIGAYALRVYELPTSPLDTLDPRARVEAVELAARLAGRGMSARPIAWGLTDRLGTQRFDVSLDPGCAAIAALRSSDLGEGDLDVRLEDDDGRLVSWDIGPPSVDRGAIPVAWVCSERARTVHVVVTSHDGRGRFLLVRGEPSRDQEAER